MIEFGLVLLIHVALADLTVFDATSAAAGACDSYSRTITIDHDEDFEGTTNTDNCDTGAVTSAATFFDESNNSTLNCNSCDTGEDYTTSIYSGLCLNLDDDGGNSSVYVYDTGTEQEREYRSIVMQLPDSDDIGAVGYFRAMNGTNSICRLTINTVTSKFQVQTNLGSGPTDTGITPTAGVNYAIRIETEEGSDGYCEICIKTSSDAADSWGDCTKETYNDNGQINRTRFEALATNHDVLFDNFLLSHGSSNAIPACEYADLP